MDDLVPDYQGRAWPEHKGIGQAGICVYPGRGLDMSV
jgi:hypothetical protein